MYTLSPSSSTTTTTTTVATTTKTRFVVLVVDVVIEKREHKVEGQQKQTENGVQKEQVYHDALFDADQKVVECDHVQSVGCEQGSGTDCNHATSPCVTTTTTTTTPLTCI